MMTTIIYCTLTTGWEPKKATSTCGVVQAWNCSLTCIRYLILDILGQGTFGQVVKCQNMKTHEIVAVKVVKNKPAYFNQSMMEVTILEMVSNVNL